MSGRIMVNGEAYPSAETTLPPEGKQFLEAWAGVNEDGVIYYDAEGWARYRAAWRETAVLTRIEFVLAAVGAGILAEEDAEGAARGEWPASFADALNTIPEAEQLAAKVTWAGLKEVPRSSSLLASIASAAAVTDEQLDTMFGYDGQ